MKHSRAQQIDLKRDVDRECLISESDKPSPNEKKQVMMIASLIRDIEVVVPTYGANDPTAIAQERQLALWIAAPVTKIAREEITEA
jgi:hypothetical protein